MKDIPPLGLQLILHREWNSQRILNPPPLPPSFMTHEHPGWRTIAVSSDLKFLRPGFSRDKQSFPLFIFKKNINSCFSQRVLLSSFHDFLMFYEYFIFRSFLKLSFILYYTNIHNWISQTQLCVHFMEKLDSGQLKQAENLRIVGSVTSKQKGLG